MGSLIQVSNGQQAAQHSLYMIDAYNLNPGYGGFDRSLSANINYRGQWTGIEKNPVHLYANAHLPVYLLNGGAGFHIKSDRTGLINRTEVGLSYNNVTATTIGTISLGLRLGLQQSRINGRQIITPDGNYSNNVFNHNDPLLPENTISTFSPTWALGLFLRNDYIDLGVTVSDLFPDKLNVEDIQVANNKLVSFYTQIPLIISEIEVLPSVLLKTDFNYIQTDISVVVKSGNIFGGSSLRGFNDNSFDSLVILGGLQLSAHYAVAYSYDVGLSALNTVTQGTHELHINYNLNKLIGIGLPPEIIYNPRNL